MPCLNFRLSAAACFGCMKIKYFDKICLLISAAAEGSHLGLFEYDELKDKEKRKSPVSLSCLTSR